MGQLKTNIWQKRRKGRGGVLSNAQHSSSTHRSMGFAFRGRMCPDRIRTAHLTLGQRTPTLKLLLVGGQEESFLFPFLAWTARNSREQRANKSEILNTLTKASGGGQLGAGWHFQASLFQDPKTNVYSFHICWVQEANPAQLCRWLCFCCEWCLTRICHWSRL